MSDLKQVKEENPDISDEFINQFSRTGLNEKKNQKLKHDDQDKKPGEPGSINGSPDANVKKTLEKKRSDFYAVCNGRMNGVFDDWSLCARSVLGYPKNVFKKFKTREEAEDSIKHYEKEREENSEKKFKYEFTIGDVVETYESWKEAEPHFINRPGLTYQRLEVCEVKKEEDEKDNVQ